MLRHLLGTAVLLIATPATAQLCDGTTGRIEADGRVLGHLPYGDASADDLVQAPPGFALNQPCLVSKDMLPDLEALLIAAQGQAAAIGMLRGLSCHRSIGRQQAVFCRVRVDADAADRAISVAPPGHSEHASGYALDFAVRPSSDCPDAEACMAATPAFRWLVANAPRFGFEMSFPAGNKQNVKWEPWHWRWVGRTAGAHGAARARFRFAAARARFPANPSVVEPLVLKAAPSPSITPDTPASQKKRKRRRR